MTTPMQHIFPPKPKGKITTPLNKEKAYTTPLSPKHVPEADQVDKDETINLLKPKTKKKADSE